jgi:flagellar motor switch protein FliM
MADDALSPEERESLLARDDSYSSPRRAARPAAARQRPAPSLSAPRRVLGRQAREERRGDALSAEVLRRLTAVHEPFVRGFAAALAPLMRCPVDAAVSAVDEQTCADWIQGLNNPTFLCVLRAAPLTGSLALDFGPSILFPMIDRLLGGGREPGPIVRRPLTDIESRLAGRLANVALVELTKAWSSIAEWQVSVERTESDPQAARIAAPTDSVLRLGCELSMHASRGVVTLCIPTCALAPLGAKLAGGDPANIPRPRTPRIAEPSEDQAAEGGTVELVARLARTQITAKEMLSLRPGDIITTTARADAPVEVCLDGTPKFLARPGTHEGRKAVQIDRPIDAPGDNR